MWVQTIWSPKLKFTKYCTYVCQILYLFLEANMPCYPALSLGSCTLSITSVGRKRFFVAYSVLTTSAFKNRSCWDLLAHTKGCSTATWELWNTKKSWSPFRKKFYVWALKLTRILKIWKMIKMSKLLRFKIKL